MYKNKDKCTKTLVMRAEQHVRYLRVTRFKLLDTSIYGSACTLINENNSPAIHDLKNCVEGISYNFTQN
jgi:hypothetical protein